jgi:hypothetical protein
MSQANPFADVRWLEPHESPFGIRVLDCRPFTTSMISSTKDSSITVRFATLRRSDGSEHRSAHPEDSVRIACSLSYNAGGGSNDGTLFRAERMEDKWDIFLHDGRLLFVRSWTGTLIFAASVSFRDGRAIVTEIEACRPQADDPTRPIRVVDFLLKTHVHRVEWPHPLLQVPGNDVQALVLGSFSEFGRWARYGTFEDMAPSAE